MNKLWYLISPKFNPTVNDEDLVNFNSMSKKPLHKWDQNNLQVYTPDMVDRRIRSCTLHVKEMSEKEKLKYWREFLKDCEDWETQRKMQPWDYKSGCLTGDRVDVHIPGRIVAKCHMAHGQIAPSVWMYDEWHESHQNDPYNRPGDHYFEVDLFESGPTTLQSKECVFFSIHSGKGFDDRRLWNSRLNGNFSNKLNYYEVQWDGYGRFVWLLNGVRVFEKKVDLHPDVAPVLVVTLGVTQPTNSRSWSVDGLWYQF